MSSDSKALSTLNEAQRKAVVATTGPVMVIAGAGSGKTRVLTHRVAYLLENGIDPFSVLALTFTNKAAREMKERVETLVGMRDARNVWMGTFHSIFARVLRSEAERLGYPRNFTIYDTDDSKNLLKSIVKENQLDDKAYTPNYLMHRISGAKSSLISAEEYNDNPEHLLHDKMAGKPETGRIFSLYTARCRKSAAMDFDDLLYNMYVMLRDFPDLLLKYQRKFEYILVDEYQDTNHAQYMILKKLAANNENLCVVGDDAQSIYAFRGATIRNILNFKRDYPDTQVFKLEQNYRSTKTIVQAANLLIRNNKDQIQKTIWTENEEGKPIRIIKAANESEEGNLIAGAIFEEKMNKQLRHDVFAVLYRTNAQSRALEEALRKLNIPYRIYGGLSFYKRKEIKDLLAYFRLAVNLKDEEALLRIVNYPARGIGKTTIEKCIIKAQETGSSVWEVIHDPGAAGLDVNMGTRRRLEDFSTMIRSFAVMAAKDNAFDTAKFIANHSGLLKTLYEDKSPEGVSRFENIEELLNAIKQFTVKDEDLIETGGDIRTDKLLAAFMQDIALLTDADNQEDDDGNHVSLMTVHAAKGLEFPFVFVSGMEDNLFPSIQSMGSREDLEEERRLFYVAMTRARLRLTLSHAEMRYKWGNLTITDPSRFLEEIDNRFVERARKVSVKPAPSYKRNPGTKTTTPPGPIDTSRMKKVGQVMGNQVTRASQSEIDAIQPGMTVEHSKFGRGKVLQVEGNGSNRKASVFFKDIGTKNMLLSFARLRVVKD